jgi:hypothetical protein
LKSLAEHGKSVCGNPVPGGSNRQTGTYGEQLAKLPRNFLFADKNEAADAADAAAWAVEKSHGLAGE